MSSDEIIDVTGDDSVCEEIVKPRKRKRRKVQFVGEYQSRNKKIRQKKNLHRRVHRRRPKVNKVNPNPNNSTETVGYDDNDPVSNVSYDHNDTASTVAYDHNDTAVTVGYSDNSEDITLVDLPDLPGQNCEDHNDENAIADDGNLTNGVKFSEISDDNELNYVQKCVNELKTTNKLDILCSKLHEECCLLDFLHLINLLVSGKLKILNLPFLLCLVYRNETKQFWETVHQYGGR